MVAVTAGAAARLRTLPAVWQNVLGRLRARHALSALLVAVLIVGAGLSLFALWSGWRASSSTIVSRAADRLSLVASVVAYELQRVSGQEIPTASQIETVRQRLPQLALADRRDFYVTDRNGEVLATTSASRKPHILSDLFSEDGVEPIEATGTVGRSRLRDGTPVLVAVKSLASGQITLIQPLEAVRPDNASTSLRDAAPVLAILLLAGIGIGWLRHLRGVRRSLMHRSRSHRIDTSLTHGRCGVWDWDTTHHRVFWSPSMYQLLGYEPRGEHLSAAEAIALMHPDDGGVRELLAALQKDDAGNLDREIRVRTGQGDWLWLRIKGETVTEPADGSRRMVGLAIDVTAERQAAERRARDDLRLREAVEALSEAFVLWDAEDRLIVCNSKFLALHGIASDVAAPGTPSREIMEAARPPVVSRSLEPQADGGARSIETQISDGRWFHVSQRRTRDGGVVSVGTDVSELKRKEAKLRARERHLQGSIRAAETAAQCYAAAAERNFEANQAKTEFMARVSHELRTPLNAIIGFSDVMRQQLLGPLDERYAGYTTGIHASGIKLLEIIDAILQMSRIEKGQFDFSPEFIALDEVVRDVIDAVREDIDAKGATIEADIRGPIMVQADGAAMREILVQLLRNAVKFSLCEGHVRVRVRSAGTRVNVFVEDSGVGIPAEMIPELGRPFAQVEAEYNRSCGGAGLGLAIANSLLEMHGGRLALRSQPGVGTIALVNLPKTQPAANDADSFEPAVLPLPRLMAAE